MAVLAPTTELEAVNEMLAAIGEAPVNALNSTLAEAQQARRQLAFTSRRTQQRGWSWNIDSPVTLIPDSYTGEITVFPNALKVDTVGDSESLNLVQRGLRLYDPQRQSYQFETSVTVSIVSGLDWSDLPEAARSFILCSAGRKFAQDTLGSDTISGFLKQDEAMAWADLLSADLEDGDYNMLTGSWAVARVLAR
jgi:hypothetical protein